MSTDSSTTYVGKHRDTTEVGVAVAQSRDNLATCPSCTAPTYVGKHAAQDVAA